MEETKNENVVISQNEMNQIDKEITAVDNAKLEEAKKSGAEEVKAQVLPTMEEIRKRQEELERKIALKELEEKEKLLKELEKPKRAGVVPESANPFKPQVQVQEQPKTSREDEWAAFENSVRSGSFRATTLK